MSTTGSATATGTAAQTSELSKVYGEGDTLVVALDAVSVQFRRGHFTAIMGPSGSGKSTLMHCMAGLDSATSGSVKIGDIELTSLDDKRLTRLRRDNLGFIFQAYNLVPTLTAIENITLPLDIAGRKPDREWLDTVIDTVRLRDRLNHRPNQLSGGQQQRVACARALAGRPDIVFADEPTGNLDSRSGIEVLEFLQRSVRDMGQTDRHGHPRPCRCVLCRPGALPRRRPHRRRDGFPDCRPGPRADEAPGVRPRARRPFGAYRLAALRPCQEGVTSCSASSSRTFSPASSALS